MKKISTRFLLTLSLIFSPLEVFCRRRMKLIMMAEGGLIQFNIFDFEGSEKYDIFFPLSEQIENLSIQD